MDQHVQLDFLNLSASAASTTINPHLTDHHYPVANLSTALGIKHYFNCRERGGRHQTKPNFSVVSNKKADQHSSFLCNMYMINTEWRVGLVMCDSH